MGGFPPKYCLQSRFHLAWQSSNLALLDLLKGEQMAKVPVSKAIKNEQDLAAVALALTDERSLTEPERALAFGAQRFLDPIFLRDISQAVRAGEDPLGDLFQHIRPPAVRREQGAIYTPRSIVNAMVGWAEGMGKFERVLDPGTGSGRFLIAAARKFPTADLVAVEADPFAALILRAKGLRDTYDDHSKTVMQTTGKDVQLAGRSQLNL